MDELAKTETRNYLNAAGFFLLATGFIFTVITNLSGGIYTLEMSSLTLVRGLGLLLIATLLIILGKRDMIAILFILFGLLAIFWSFDSIGAWNAILLIFLILVMMVVLTSKDKLKWLLFIFPLILLINAVLYICIGNIPALTAVVYIILAALSVYYAFACASERISLPGRNLLTADETTDFKASGSVLGYMLFALISGGYALHYLIGETVLPLATFQTMELICGVLMVFVAILLLTVGKMRFTPVMFLLLGLTNILAIYATGYMFIGIGILWIVIGLFAMLRTESRILPGIMLIIYGCTAFFTAYANGAMVSAPVVSVILNAIPCLIAIYLSFVVYSQRKLPKF